MGENLSLSVRNLFTRRAIVLLPATGRLISLPAKTGLHYNLFSLINSDNKPFADVTIPGLAAFPTSQPADKGGPYLELKHNT